jgi:hypothetical protein
MIRACAFSCSIKEMPIYKIALEEARSEAVFPGSEWSIPMFRADFPHFTLKTVEVWPNLPVLAGPAGK